MEVGVRALKQRLSQYLDRAARGEVILVTDRGRPKAALGPPPGRANVERGVAEGWIRPGDGTPPRPARRWPARASIAEVMQEDRGE